MDITVKITGEEIINTPNDLELGTIVRNKYWQERRNQEGPPVDDEQFIINIDENGLVKGIVRPWTCSICGEKTDEVDNDYLIGWDHLTCRLDRDVKDEFDTCVLCGKQSPYKRSTHIDMREGYVEGGGQGCFQPHICNKN